MTTIDTARLRALADAATPGPWEADDNQPFSRELQGIFAPGQKRYVLKVDFDKQPENARDAEFIAAADPQTMLALLDEVDAARAERDERFFQAQREMGASEEFIKNLRGLMAGIEATGTPYQPLAKSGDGDA